MTTRKAEYDKFAIAPEDDFLDEVILLKAERDRLRERELKLLRDLEAVVSERDRLRKTIEILVVGIKEEILVLADQGQNGSALKMQDALSEIMIEARDLIVRAEGDRE